MRNDSGSRYGFPVVLITIMTAALLLPVLPAAAGEPDPGGGKVAGASQERRVVAYYFHGTKRCSTCLKLEEYSLEALRSGFAAEMKDGALVWKPVNYDKPKNKHFVEEYQLYTKALVLVEMVDGKQVRFENLDRIWELVHNRSAFSDYVEQSVRAFMEPD